MPRDSIECTCDICFGLSQVPHGPSGYNRFACRCGVCRAAATAARAESRRRAKLRRAIILRDALGDDYLL